LRIAACLGNWLAFLGQRGDLGGFELELAGFNYPSCLRFFLLCRLYVKLQKKERSLYLGHIVEFERKKKTCQVKIKEQTGGMPRYARHE
jgi:hypothetical protein